MNTDEQHFIDTIDAIARDEQQADPRLEEVRHFYHSTMVAERMAQYQKYNIKKAYKLFLRNTHEQRPVAYRRYVAWAAAAVFAGFIMTMPFMGGNKPSEEVMAMLEKHIPALTDSVPVITTNTGQVILLDHADDNMDVAGTSAYVTESGIAMNNTDKEESLLELVVPYGRQYQIALPDGTAITLNSGSKLKFPNRMDLSRRVYLEGEAYFDVKKNGRPFKVSTSAGTITVMGTTFNVRSYDANHAGVALYSGQVMFSAGDNDYLLHPGEEVVKEGDDITIQPISDPRASAWRNGLIVFRNQRLEAIMAEIARIYGVEVEFKADVRDIRFSGECRRTETVDEFMQKMGLTDEFDYEINGNKITIQ